MAKKDRTPGPGLAALAPRGLIGRPRETVPPGRSAWSITGSKGTRDVDRRLADILAKAAARFQAENPGYSVQGFSGKTGRRSGTQWHPGGIAMDVNITDPKGRKLGNYQDPNSFRIYEKFAQKAREYQQQAYPELDNSFRFGGYFGGRYAFDQMHLDLGPTSMMGMGSWQHGLRPGALPGAESIGMGTVRGIPTDRAPVPFSRDMPNPNSLRPSMLDGIPATGVNGVSRAPLGPVSMPSTPAQSASFGGALTAPTSLANYTPAMSMTSAPAAPAPRGPDMAAMPSVASLSPVKMASTPLSPVSSQFAAPSPADLASAYAQMGQTLQQAGVNLAGTALPAPNAPVAMPPAPVQQLAPPPVQQMPPPRQIVPQSLPSAFPDTPPAPPSFSPADIYGGQVGTAQASGGNTVGRDPFGRTTVTNQYGVTTATTPDGKQAAYGGAPGMPGPSSIFGGGRMSPKAGGLLGGLLGAAAGAAVAGPMGGIVGGLLGRSMMGGTPTGSIFGGNRSSFGSGRTASEAEANRGGRGVTAGGTGLW